MPWEIFTKIIDEGARYGSRSYSLHIFNEPMLSPYWPGAIKYIHAKNGRNKVLLTTNGTAINARVDDLISANPDQILWTWRTEAKFTPETKEKLRKWGKFRVRFIKEVTPPEAYEEWKDWKNVEGRPLHNYGGNINTSSFKDTAQTAMDGTPSQQKRWPCYHLWLAPAVAWNGDILICCADPHHKEVIGRFPDMSVHEAWKSEKVKSIRESHMNGQYTGICQSCDIWKQYPDIFFNAQKGKK